ncbi:zinc finger, CCHC-type containing protein [Tanacetum coccineum]
MIQSYGMLDWAMSTIKGCKICLRMGNSAFDMDTKKCKTCMLTKITKKLFQNVKRETEVLELIHSDLCDLHATPSLGNKKGLGCREVVRLPDLKLKTLGKRGIECIFVRYDEHSKAFRFFVIEPNESVLINSIIESRDVIFDENTFSSVPRPSPKIHKIEDIGGSVVPEKVDLTKEFLSLRFYMKDMGEADVILGIKIKHESNGIAISQSYYIEKILKKFNYFDCTPVSTPIDTSEKLMPNNGQCRI